MKNIIIYTVIPFFSNGIEVNQNEIKSFVDRDEASQYRSNFSNHSELVESELSLSNNQEKLTIEKCLETVKELCVDTNESEEALNNKANWLYIMNRLSFWNDMPVVIQMIQFEKQKTKTEFSEDVRNKLTPFKNLIALIDNGLLDGTVSVHPIIQEEIKQCKENLEYLSK